MKIPKSVPKEYQHRSFHKLIPRIQARLSESALKKNFRILHSQVRDTQHQMIPMVKADGYGHGATWVAKILLASNRKKIYGLGVATLKEGAILRTELGGRHSHLPIIVFSGTLDWNENKLRFCEQFGLSPTIASFEDWKRFLKSRGPKRLSYHIKFNTGMNRLGIDQESAESIIRSIVKLPSNSRPDTIYSHLAIGESPNHTLSRKQLRAYAELVKSASRIPGIRFHLANSAAIWNSKLWKIKEHSNLSRPGLSLYGIRPWVSAPKRGLTPVMSLQARVLQTRTLEKGDRMGYGGTFLAKKKTKTGILASGYADGIQRILSNRGHIFVSGSKHPVLGTVSMDLFGAGIAKTTRVGDWAEILGSRIDAWHQSKVAETIPYELLTSVSKRVERIHVR